MNDALKYRLIGAAFWLGLLVLWVPSWFSHPVAFKPQPVDVVAIPTPMPTDKPLRLPVGVDTQVADETVATSRANESESHFGGTKPSVFTADNQRQPFSLQPHTENNPIQITTAVQSSPPDSSKSTPGQTRQQQSERLKQPLPHLLSDELLSDGSTVPHKSTTPLKADEQLSPTDGNAWIIQLVCYSTFEQTLDISEKLRTDYHVRTDIKKSKDKPVYCVGVGPIFGKQSATHAMQTLNKRFRVKSYLIPFHSK